MTTTHAKPCTTPSRNATCLNGEGGGYLQSVIDAVAALDLDPMKVKLMDSGEGPGWDRDTADRVEARYRQFLVLAACFGGAVPTRPIDEFWHAHILDTRKYAEDCDKAFGRFLHHFPYFGMRGEDDRRNLEAAFARTLDLVEAVFGPGARWDAVAQGGAPGTSFCSTDCSEGNCTPIPSCESADGIADPYRRSALPRRAAAAATL